MNDLLVPRHHIYILLDSKATKAAIEDAFMSHLVNNPSIQKGDAIIIYFAGHGSTAIAPDGWQNSNALRVEMLCPYDHGTRSRGGRIIGLTDWSVHAMLMELSESKGDNVTLILDCCFSPSPSHFGALSRAHTRWTPPGNKFTSDDLYAGLWRGALGRKVSFEGRGFYQNAINSHITVLACSQGERAVEDKEGGRFTMGFLAATGTRLFHQTSYDQLVGNLPFIAETNIRCASARTRIVSSSVEPHLHPTLVMFLLSALAAMSVLSPVLYMEWWKVPNLACTSITFMALQTLSLLLSKSSRCTQRGPYRR